MKLTENDFEFVNNRCLHCGKIIYNGKFCNHECEKKYNKFLNERLKEKFLKWWKK